MATGSNVPSPTATHPWLKPALWSVMGLMTLSVIRYSEYPIFRQAQEQAYLKTIPFLIIPHAVCGIAAFIIGPFQFSSRLRRRYLKLHRVLGRVYVGSVFIAAAQPARKLEGTNNKCRNATYRMW